MEVPKDKVTKMLEPLIVKSETVECIVDKQYGTISPQFTKITGVSGISSGSLKYFQSIAGKRVKITIEVKE